MSILSFYEDTICYSCDGVRLLVHKGDVTPYVLENVSPSLTQKSSSPKKENDDDNNNKIRKANFPTVISQEVFSEIK